MIIVPKLGSRKDSLYRYQSFAEHNLPQIDKLLHFNPIIAHILTLSFPFHQKY